MNVHFIAITGGSGSGKSWLARELEGRLGNVAGRLALDDFYHDLSSRTPADREQVNFDDPDAIEWPLFEQVLDGIRRGQDVELPSYDYVSHTRRPTLRSWRACPLVLLDGLWLWSDPRMRRNYSVSVYLECPPAVRLARRLDRDHLERGRSAAAARLQFEQQVIPMHERFVAPQLGLADLVLTSPVAYTDLSRLADTCRGLLS